MIIRDSKGRFVKGSKVSHDKKTKEKIRLLKKGKPLSEVHKLNLSISHSNLSKETIDRMKVAAKKRLIDYGHPFLNRHHSENSIILMRNAKLGLRGKEANNWQEGRKKLQGIRGCARYEQWKLEVKIKDKFTCKDCGRIGINFEVHHKKPFAQILKENNIVNIEEAMNCEELWNVENGETLCKDCHKFKILKIFQEIRI